jgi:hypothetical protein
MRHLLVGLCLALSFLISACDSGPAAGCQTDADCAAGEVCASDGTCQASTLPPTACTADTDCQNGDHCDVGTGECIATPAPGSVAIGDPCLEDADCEPGDACDATTGICVAQGA